MKVKVIGKKYSNFLDSNGKIVEIYGVFLTHKNPLDLLTYYDHKNKKLMNTIIKTKN